MTTTISRRGFIKKKLLQGRERKVDDYVSSYPLHTLVSWSVVQRFFPTLGRILGGYTGHLGVGEGFESGLDTYNIKGQ